VYSINECVFRPQAIYINSYAHVYIYLYIYICIRRRLTPCTVFVTAGTDIAITAISAPADVPPPDGVRPRSD